MVEELRQRLARLTLALDSHAGVVIGASTVLLAMIGVLDYVTGYEFGFFIFYFIPVAITAWFSRLRTALTMAAIAAVCWYLSDLLSDHPYSRAYLIYWETFMRFVSFFTTGLTVARIRQIGVRQLRLEEELAMVRAENDQLRRRLVADVGEEGP